MYFLLGWPSKEVEVETIELYLLNSMWEKFEAMYVNYTMLINEDEMLFLLTSLLLSWLITISDIFWLKSFMDLFWVFFFFGLNNK